ncbi:MAG: Sensory box histidine kinase, partial [Verrucomicrobiales bacterium]|nr:Sensory box histidine kinase [Verrucomicrobiales bacterium]
MKQRFTTEFVSKLKSFFVEPPTDAQRSSALWCYGTAALYIAIAFGIRWALNPVLSYQAPFILFIPVILLVAWRAGLGPALFASLSTFLLVNYFFIFPADQWNPLDASEVAAAATYIVSAVAGVSWAQTLRTERKRVIEKANESVEHAQRLRNELKQRQVAEEQLQEREERLRAIMENSPTMIFLKDAGGRYLMANRQFEKIIRRPVAEIIGLTDAAIFPPEQAVNFCGNDHKVLDKGEPVECEEVALHEDGPHTSIVQKFPLRDRTGKVYAVGGIVTDITERKQWEKAVAESEKKYRSLYRNTPAMMHSIDRTGRLLSVSNFWLKLLGYKREEVLGRNFTEFLTAVSRNYAREALPAYFKHGACSNVPYQVVKKNGEIIDVLMSGIAEKDEEENVVRALAVLTDVTAQNRAEQALRASESRYRQLIDLLPVAVYTTDGDGHVTLCNQHAIELFGRQPEIGKDLWCSS